MADVSLSQAAARFAETVKDSSRQTALAELQRFVRWYGPERAIAQMRGHDVSLYADVLGPATSETSRRADQVRGFLAFLKKEGLLDSNLAPHLRLKNRGKAAGGLAAARQETVELTKEGIEALQAELESLGTQRLAVREEIRKAMLDKDFRENSPLDAAKDKQGHIEARVREIEAMLKRAVVVDGAASGGRVRVGSKVLVKNLGTGAAMRYLIVGPTEANAADGKISSASPVGKALLDARAGDEVEVSVPAGVMRFQVEAVEG
jgi:transcription elongation factor GreA